MRKKRWYNGHIKTGVCSTKGRKFMAKKTKGKDYFGFPRVASIILAIIPVTAWILGFLTRLKDGKILAAIIRLIGIGFILWLVDLILVILNGRILRLLPI